MGEWAVLTSPAERRPPPADQIESLAHTFEQGAPLTFRIINEERVWMRKVSHLCAGFLLLMKLFLDGQLDSLV